MTSFRFLHAADIHLDSPLTGLANIEGRVAERIRTAPRAAFEALVELAIGDQVGFLVIAGDLYDGTWRDYKTGLFFTASRCPIPVGLADQFGCRRDHATAIRIALIFRTKIIRTRSSKCGRFGETGPVENGFRPNCGHAAALGVRLPLTKARLSSAFRRVPGQGRILAQA